MEKGWQFKISLSYLERQLQEVGSDLSQLFGFDGGVASVVDVLHITRVVHSIVGHNLQSGTRIEEGTKYVQPKVNRIRLSTPALCSK